MLIKIEVAFATAALQKIIPLEIEATTSLADVVQLSGIEQFFPEY